ncbi:hypothetical protein [Methylocaldum szegediense]|nr:hypothetical protein [Methylocaldum szegediense]
MDTANPLSDLPWGEREGRGVASLRSSRAEPRAFGTDTRLLTGLGARDGGKGRDGRDAGAVPCGWEMDFTGFACESRPGSIACSGWRASCEERGHALSMPISAT